MKRLWDLLFTGSWKDLVKYKSFFLLVLLLFLLDKGLKRIFPLDKGALQLPELARFQADLAAQLPYVANDFFLEFPERLGSFLWQFQTLLLLAGLFLLKQAISLWPSSDLRRMHRQEREAFGLWHSLLVLRWSQVLWDALAVGIIVALGAAWVTWAFYVGFLVWDASRHLAGLLTFGLLAAAFSPVAMAAFSYSSKFAVLSRGSFGDKFRLYLLLFWQGRIFVGSYLFYSARVVIELIFVALIPSGVLLFIENPWVRFPLAALCATPVYGFLKMASFKFFLFLFEPYPLVRAEFAEAYSPAKKP